MDSGEDYGLIIPMNIDTGMAVVIVAVLLFYLRLIIIQRERARRAAKTALPVGKSQQKKPQAGEDFVARYSILSPKRRDLVIAGGGMLAIAVGILVNLEWIGMPGWQAYWWVPTALGIIAFSWAFKL